MCLIVFSWNPRSPRERLTVAANRDELYCRAIAAAHWWQDAPTVFAGRDLDTMGSWLGITREGRFAALSHIRAPGENNPCARSRGRLIAEFLVGHESPAEYLERITQRLGRYNAFNLVVGDLYGHGGQEPSLWYCASTEAQPRALGPGVYGISNDVLDTPWPKTLKAVGEMALLNASEAPADAYLRMLADTSEASDRCLPNTGVSPVWEKKLSAVFVHTPHYGTRASTWLHAQANGEVEVVERSYHLGQASGDAQTRFQVPVRDALHLPSSQST